MCSAGRGEGPPPPAPQEPEWEFQWESGPVASLCFGCFEPGRTHLIAGTGDGCVLVIDAESGLLLRAHELHPMPVRAVTTPEVGAVAYSGCEAGVLYRIDATGTEKMDLPDTLDDSTSLNGTNFRIHAMQCLADGSQLVISLNLQLIVFDLTSQTVTWNTASDYPRM